MIKAAELKPGDVIRVNDDGVEREGIVTKVDHIDHKVQVNNGVQEFWYGQDELRSLPLDEDQLKRFGFAREEQDGVIKYKKDSFRLVTPRPGDFSHIDMWWREDRRHFNTPISVHQLQNLYLDMTKVHLELS